VITYSWTDRIITVYYYRSCKYTTWGKLIHS